MYDLFKYYDVLELEKEYKDKFDDINPTKSIAILPPVLKVYHGKYVLAYLVMSQPESSDNHYGITRPIGAILRNYKSKKIVRVVNCKNEEFAPNRNDFLREYYNLEDHNEWWPNRTTDNEEIYRIALEKLYKVCQSIKLFGPYKKSYYDDYINTIKTMYSEEYWYFFEALQNNPIKSLDDELIYQRDLAKKEHEVRAQKRQEKQIENTAIARELFIEEVKSSIRDFVNKEISATLKNKPSYAKIDFYRFLGNMLKDIYGDTTSYINCYNSTLTPTAIAKNKDNFKETLKVNLIKTYAKACVKTSNNDEEVNSMCDMFIKFLDTMLEQERTGKVTEQTKQIVKQCMYFFTTQINNIQSSTMKSELESIYNGLVADYYEVTDPSKLSNVYLGYSLMKQNSDADN